jgi:hypothetical protein
MNAIKLTVNTLLRMCRCITVQLVDPLGIQVRNLGYYLFFYLFSQFIKRTIDEGFSHEFAVVQVLVF